MKNKPKWWNNEIKSSLSLKKRAQSKYISTHYEADKFKLDGIRRETKRLIKHSKKNLEKYTAEASKSNPKEFYRYVNNKKAECCSIGPLDKKLGYHTNEGNEMATILNNFFASVFTGEDCLSVQPSQIRRTLKISKDMLIIEGDVLHALERLK